MRIGMEKAINENLFQVSLEQFFRQFTAVDVHFSQRA